MASNTTETTMPMVMRMEMHEAPMSAQRTAPSTRWMARKSRPMARCDQTRPNAAKATPPPASTGPGTVTTCSRCSSPASTNRPMDGSATHRHEYHP